MELEPVRLWSRMGRARIVVPITSCPYRGAHIGARMIVPIRSCPSRASLPCPYPRARVVRPYQRARIGEPARLSPHI